MKKPELLIPAGSLEVLKTAVIFGADAVYIGGGAFGLRAKAKNFSKEEMEEGISFAHEHGAKVHVTVNILAHNGDLAGVGEYLKELKELKPDALIIADPGIFTMAREICPEIDIHISTQANNTNYETFRFWQRLGQNVSFQRENFLWQKLRRSGRKYRKIWKSRALFMGRCAFLIRADAFSAVTLPEEMRTRGHAPIPAVGNMLW